LQKLENTILQHDQPPVNAVSLTLPFQFNKNSLLLAGCVEASGRLANGWN
jgi:hypothetical protein